MEHRLLKTGNNKNKNQIDKTVKKRLEKRKRPGQRNPHFSVSVAGKTQGIIGNLPFKGYLSKQE